MPPILPGRSSPGHFPSTHWSRVLAAGNPDAPEAYEALANLCQSYWYPIYAYVRRKGHTPEQAQDLTQDFFAYVLERDLAGQGRPRPGPVPRLSADRLRQTSLRRARAGECTQAGRRQDRPVDRRRGRRGAIFPRAVPRADSGADLRPDLGADAAGTGLRPASKRVRCRRASGDFRRASSRAHRRLPAGFVRDDRSPAGQRARARSGSPSIAFAADTASCFARRSPPPSMTRTRSTTRSGRSFTALQE